MANLAGLEGSCRRRAIHSHANTGASEMTNRGCTNWNQLAGYSKPRMLRLVARSANRFRDDPAWSKADQNRADAMKRTRTATDRLLSAGDQPGPKISQMKTPAQ